MERKTNRSIYFLSNRHRTKCASVVPFIFFPVLFFRDPPALMYSQPEFNDSRHCGMSIPSLGREPPSYLTAMIVKVERQ